MKIIKTNVGKKTLRLIYNANAMLEINNLYGKDGQRADIRELTKDDSALDNLCTIGAIMSEQGELYRRHFGYEAGDTVTAEELKLICKPAEIMALRIAIISAMVEGMSTEVTDEDEEVDVGLLELQKNKKKGSQKQK